MRAFFLDRDGTLNVDTNFVHTPEEWQWCKGALEAIRWLNENAFKIIVVTNQSGIARGKFTKEQVHKLHNWVDEQLNEQGLWIDDWYIAPHHPEYDPAPYTFSPNDRKPGTGMFLKAIEKHGIHPQKSFMAGDKITDLKPALKLGIQPFFLQSRHEPFQDKQWIQKNNIPTHPTLLSALQQIKGSLLL